MKRFTSIILLAAFVLAAWATAADANQIGYIKHEVEFKDDLGRPIEVTSLSIYLPNSTTQATIYMDAGLINAITQPITESSTNTTLVNGKLVWWGPGSWEFSVTDDQSRTVTSGSAAPIDASVATIVIPIWFTAVNTAAYGDASTITLGADGDWVVGGGATANRLTFTPGADGSTLYLGAAATQTDMRWFAGTGTTYITWDEGANTETYTGVSAIFDDASFAKFGTDSDWTFSSSTAKQLDILPATSDESSTIMIGADTAGADLKLFAAGTGDYWLVDASDSSFKFVDTDIKLDDDAVAYFGSDLDFSIKASTAKTLDILPVTTDESSIVDFGADTAGVDVKLFGATTAEYVLWDASADTLSTNCGNVAIVTTDAETNQFQVTAGGTVAGNAVNIATTDGGIILTAGGAGNGDVAITAGDDMTLTTTGNLTLAVSGTLSAGGSAITNAKDTVELVTANDVLTAAETGKILVVDGNTVNVILTLPTAAAGLRFTIVDANSTAGSDVYVKAGDSDTIQGGTAGQYYACKTDSASQAITLEAVDATRWILVSSLGTWVADDTPD